MSQRVLASAWGAGQPEKGAWAYVCVHVHACTYRGMYICAEDRLSLSPNPDQLQNQASHTGCFLGHRRI